MNSSLTYRTRLRTLVARCGESFDLTRAGVVTPQIGVFGIAEPATVSAYFDPATASALTRPVLTLTLDGAAPAPQAGDTLTRDGRALTVRLVDIQRVSATVVGFYALLD